MYLVYGAYLWSCAACFTSALSGEWGVFHVQSKTWQLFCLFGSVIIIIIFSFTQTQAANDTCGATLSVFLKLVLQHTIFCYLSLV